MIDYITAQERINTPRFYLVRRLHAFIKYHNLDLWALDLALIALNVGLVAYILITL